MNGIARLIPELLLSTGGTAALIISALRDDRSMREFVKWFSFFIVAAAAVFLIGQRGVADPVTADGWLTTGPISLAFGLVFMIIVGWTILAGNVPTSSAGEWYGLLLFAGLGMLVLARSMNIAAVFLGVEILSLCLYVLIAFSYEKKLSLRGGVMYLVLAGFASGFLVFGLALVYCVYGTMDISQLEAQIAAAKNMNVVALIGFGFFLAGVGFKLAVAPFHMWAADVYEAAPGAVSGIIASASKGAILAAFVPFAFLLNTHWQIIWMIAVVSIILGNLLGLREIRVKRILAYSSIAHIGYVLVGYLAMWPPTNPGAASSALLPNIDGVTAILFYIVAYGISILGSFVALSLMERESELTLRDIRGVARKNAPLAYSMLVFVISLAGLPPTIGFFGKIYLFSAAVTAGYTWLPIIGLAGSAIGIFYYLRIVVHLFMMPSDVAEVKIADSPFQNRILIGSALATILLGIMPDIVFALLHVW